MSRGSAELLRESGIRPDSIDDDGVAIFWLADRFVPVSLNVQVFPAGCGGALQVRLRENVSGGREVIVMGAHLSSGSDLKDEEARLSQQVDVAGGLCELARKAQCSDEAIVLCLDANSHPQIGVESGMSVWRSLHNTLG